MLALEKWFTNTHFWDTYNGPLSNGPGPLDAKPDKVNTLDSAQHNIDILMTPHPEF